MNGSFWLTANAALLLTAGIATVGISRLSRTQLPAFQEQPAEETTHNPPATKLPSGKTESRPATPAKPQSASDEIWQKSLFRPDRAEETASAEGQGDSAKQLDVQQANAEFELVGIARIGLPDQGHPVAIILQKSQNPRTSRNRNLPSRNSSPNRQAPAQQTSQPKLKSTFQVGDHVNQSGYTLAEINLEKKSVLLTRGAERLQLAISMGDDKSRQRKDASVSFHQEKQKERETPKPAAAQPQPATQAAAQPQPAAQAAGKQTPANTAATPRGDAGTTPPVPPANLLKNGNLSPRGFNRRSYSGRQGSDSRNAANGNAQNNDNSNRQ